MPHSNWTATANSISLTPVTTTLASGSSPENVNYLTNTDKIALMAQYSAMLATKTTLDETASSLGISSSFYDNACADISSTLIAAGAPSNWATIWPDGTTSGPWPDIQGDLANLWAQIASQQTALQTAISSAQAAAAETAAIAQAATAATTQLNAAVSALGQAPVVVSSLPTLPNASFAPGTMVWLTSDSQLYTNVGNTWFTLAVPATGIAGVLTASQIASLSAAQLTGQITSTQISDGAVSTPQLAAGSITSAQIAAGAVVAGAIAAGAVTAGTLAAGAVTAGTLAANAVTAGTIAAGAIGADEIAANSILASQLTITDTTNICGNGSGATGTDGWAGAITAYPGQNLFGQSSILSTGDRDAYWTPAVINVTPGEAFSFSVYCCPGNQAVGAAAPSGPFSVGLEIANDPAFATSPTWIAACSAPQSSTSGWVQITGQAVIPAGATVARIWAQIGAAAGSTGVWAFTALTVRKAASGELLVDGTITASKLAVGAISADLITTGTLNAALVTVTNLNASNITTGTLDATQVVFPDGTAVSTAARVLTYPAGLSSLVTIVDSPATPVSGLSWTVTSSGPTDTFNVTLALECSAEAPTAGAVVLLVIDGNTGSPAGSRSLPRTDYGWLPVLFSVSGLSAGSHTFAIYADNAASYQFYADSYGILQRVF